MKTNIFLQILAILTILSFITAISTAQTPQQQQQLDRIDRYIAQRRVSTQEYFDNQIEAVERRGQNQLMIFEKIEMDLISEHALNYFDYRLVPVGYFRAPQDKLIAFADIEQTRKNIEAEKVRINRKLAYDIARLERLQAYILTVRLVELEKQLKDNVLNPKPKPATGTITGIVYSDRPAAAISEKIVHNNENIDSNKVIAIKPDNVEFEKDGQRWKQQVGEPGGDRW